MKKTIVILIVTLLLVGCSHKDKYKTYKCSQVSDQSASGYKVTTNYKIYSNDGIVDKVEISDVVDSKDKAILNFFKKQYESQYKSINEKYGGYTYEIKKEKNKLISNVTINYKEFNMKDFVKDNKGMKTYINKDNKITLEGIRKMYTNIGATCK